MKKIIKLFSVLLCVLMISGCSAKDLKYPAYKTYYTKTSEYSEVMNRTEFYAEYKNNEKIFPKTFNDSDVAGFFCRYDEKIPLGESFQILLELKYETEEFEKEIERIKQIAVSCNEKFENDFDAYSILMDKYSCCEYVLVDTNNLRIYYVYLQSVPRDEIEFESSFLPKDYKGIEFFEISIISDDEK